MIVGLGLDLFDASRLEDEVRRHGSAEELDVFAPGELERSRASRRPARALACCFAAKEALIKALSLGDSEGWRWRDVEVSSFPDAAPSLTLHGRLADLARRRGVDRVVLAMASTRGHVMATVILEDRS